mmetsp:Transcript_16798/g.46261  ORF Transcript_16798/g.46261 Transcript_16798/m.46261 type:complete len:240 (-) Transcript_16798:255-974(-)
MRPAWDGEHLAVVAEFATASPADALRWCTVARRFLGVFSSFDLWRHVVTNVHWPPPASKRDDVLSAYGKIGQHCKCLSYDGVRGGLSDLALLAQCCPAVEALEVTGLGADGVERDVWKAWGGTLQRVRLAFHYDAIDGPAEIREVLSDLVAHCLDIKQLTISGVDWPSARTTCLESLTTVSKMAGVGGHGGSGNLPKLSCLSLLGSEARLSLEERHRLTNAWPGLVIKATMRDAPNLDW